MWLVDPRIVIWASGNWQSERASCDFSWKSENTDIDLALSVSFYWWGQNKKKLFPKWLLIHFVLLDAGCSSVFCSYYIVRFLVVFKWFSTTLSFISPTAFTPTHAGHAQSLHIALLEKTVPKARLFISISNPRQVHTVLCELTLWNCSECFCTDISLIKNLTHTEPVVLWMVSFTLGYYDENSACGITFLSVHPKGLRFALWEKWV